MTMNCETCDGAQGQAELCRSCAWQGWCEERDALTAELAEARATLALYREALETVVNVGDEPLHDIDGRVVNAPPWGLDPEDYEWMDASLGHLTAPDSAGMSTGALQWYRVHFHRVCDERDAITAERDALAQRVRELEAENAALLEALKDLAHSGNDQTDARLPWTNLQVDKGDLARALTLLASLPDRARSLLDVVEAADRLVAVCEAENRSIWPFGSSNNSPGHCHVAPPRWDDTGEECERCAAWMRLRAALAAHDGTGE